MLFAGGTTEDPSSIQKKKKKELKRIPQLIESKHVWHIKLQLYQYLQIYTINLYIN